MRNGKWVNETETYIDWQHRSGSFIDDFNINLYAGNDQDENVSHLTHFFETSGAMSDAIVPPSSDVLKETVFLHDVKDIKEEWESRGKSHFDTYVKNEVTNRAPGDEIRSIRTNVSFPEFKEHDTYFPFWLVSYDYAGQKFYTCVDGLNGERATGIRPEDKERRARVKKMTTATWIWGTIIALVLTGVFFLLKFAFKIEPMPYWILAIVGGVDIITILIINYVKKRRVWKKNLLIRQQILEDRLQDLQ
jgi:hypothetical protein